MANILGTGVEFVILDEVSSDEDYDEFDFNHPEDVVIYIIDLGEPCRSYAQGDWKQFEIEEIAVLSDDGIIGAASYDDSYGGFLNYTIEGMIDCPCREGYFMVEGVTGIYTKGDGWTTDDDMDFYYEGVRELTPEEILEHVVETSANFWASEPENIA